MLLRYIEATVYHNSKNYSFTDRDISFDQKNSSILLSKSYIEHDIDWNINYVYSIFYNELLERKLYSSLSNVERAVRTGALHAMLCITYCNDINKSKDEYLKYMHKLKSLEEVDKYCSGVRYYYDLKTKNIERYEVYGDIALGDEIKREISYYDQFEV